MRLALAAGTTALSLMAFPFHEPRPRSDPGTDLQRMTQELYDAVSLGDSMVWHTYLDSTVSFTDENGQLAGKDRMVSSIRPLPPGVSGTIVITEWRANVLSDVAVTTYVSDEHETFHGQRLHAHYRETDTWIRRPAGWRLIGAQVLALQRDPPALTVHPESLTAYIGRYAAAPDYLYAIERQGDSLVARVNGGRAQSLRAETRDVWFTPGQPRTRKIFRRDASGRIVGLVSRREGEDVVFQRLP